MVWAIADKFRGTEFGVQIQLWRRMSVFLWFNRHFPSIKQPLPTSLLPLLLRIWPFSDTSHYWSHAMFVVWVWFLSLKRKASRFIYSLIMAGHFSSLSLGTILWHLYPILSLSTCPFIDI